MAGELSLNEAAGHSTQFAVMKHAKQPSRWALAVYVVVRDTKGRILMLRRARTRGHFRGLWELPGGKPAPSERIDTTARLEVAEECGLCVYPTEVAGAVDGSIRGMRVAMLILEGRTRSTKVTLSEEHDAFCWLPLDQVEELDLRPGFERFFASYAKQRGKPKAGRIVQSERTVASRVKETKRR